MDTVPLTSAEKKELRGIAQRLKPHVHIGKQGLTESVLEEIDTALTKNGLVKVRFVKARLETDQAAIQQYCVDIPAKLGCEYVGGVGNTGIFFREMPETEKV